MLSRLALITAAFLIPMIGMACNSDDRQGDVSDNGNALEDNPDDDAGESFADDDVDNDSGDDDTGDDDTGDDTLDDDTIDDDIDDDSAGDDDTSDDDTSDDDTGDDDDAFPGCEGDIYGSDDCAKWMYELYCGFEYPVILDETLYTQGVAVDDCRVSTDPRWHAVRNCMSSVSPESDRDNFCSFVACMSATGTPAENTDVFDATQTWDLPGFAPATQSFASLNYWCIHSDDPYMRLEYWGLSGAMRHPAVPDLRAKFVWVWAVGPYPAVWIVEGNSILTIDPFVSFWMTGWFITDDPEGGSPMQWTEWEMRLIRRGPP